MEVLPSLNGLQNQSPLIAFNQEKQFLILIAEVDKKHRERLKDSLSVQGVDFLEVVSGEEAVDATVLERPDLILLNTTLPGLDGFEVARLIRSISSFDRVPIIFFSDCSQSASRKKALAAGGNDYLVEPHGLKRLRNQLAKLIAEKYCN